MQANELDVLVVGAGPVGLTLAGQLARRGLRVAAIDKGPGPTDKSKALVLWPRTLELLAAAGVVEPFLAAGLRVRGGRVFGRQGQLAWIDFSRNASAYPFVLMIPQSATEQLLDAAARAAGAAVERHTELMRFSADASGVHAVVRDADGVEQQRDAAWLVGCDGAHSTVRHALGLAFAGSAENNDWALADVRIDGDLPRDEVRMFLHPDGVVAAFPLPPDRTRLIIELGPARGAQPHDPTLVDVQALLDERAPGLRAVDPAWLGGFRINERQVPTYRIGRVFLAGDAAHVHSPAGGQGMNTGMHDAFNLAWKLGLVQGGRGRETLLDSYQAERHPIGAMIVRGAGALTSMATLRGTRAQQLRNRVVPILARLPPLQRRIVNLLCEVSIHYRGATLSRDARSAAVRLAARWGGVRAGERLPDAELRQANGEAVRLFDLLRTPAHVLLMLAPDATAAGIAAQLAGRYGALLEAVLVSRPGAPAPANGLRVLHDADSALHRAYAASQPTAVVVRPDGYVGYLGPAGGVAEYLATYLM
ncbi:MAG: FAD-dependent monooxygenase [bacterium]